MSRVTIVPTHRLPLSSRDNLALRYEGPFPSSDTVDLDGSDGFGSHNPERESFDETGLSFFAGVANALCLIAFGVIVAVCVYLLAGGW